MDSQLLFYCSLTAILGYLAAFAELLSRYKSPGAILKSSSSQIYMLINASSGFFAYWYLSGKEFAEGNEISFILVAGTSSLVLLRSSIASIKVGDKNIEAGFASILQVFLDWADRTFDQSKAKSALPDVQSHVKNMSFDKAKLALPTTCFYIMKNITSEEKEKIGSEVAILTNAPLDNEVKCLNLCILMLELMGKDLLEEAINSLGDSIKKTAVENKKTNENEDDSPMSKLDKLIFTTKNKTK